jgi:hypothetical protein
MKERSARAYIDGIQSMAADYGSTDFDELSRIEFAEVRSPWARGRMSRKCIDSLSQTQVLQQIGTEINRSKWEMTPLWPKRDMVPPAHG